MGRAGITGTGLALPERCLANRELAATFGLDESWIESRSGVRERRLAEPGEAASDLGARAARVALDRAGVAAAEVDMIIFATNTPDHLVPAAGCTTQHLLGAHRAAAFDLIAGCSGAVYAMAIAAQFIATGVYRTVLVIGSEVMARILDWRDPATCVLFGDGAGALVMQEVPSGRGIISFRLGAEGQADPAIIIPAGGSRRPASAETVAAREHYVRMQGREVYRFAVRVQDEVCEAVLREAGLGPADVDLFVPHQANLRIIEGAARRLGIPMERVLVTVDRFANTSSASIPMALAWASEMGRLGAGDLVLLTGFGAGLTYAGMLLRW